MSLWEWRQRRVSCIFQRAASGNKEMRDVAGPVVVEAYINDVRAKCMTTASSPARLMTATRSQVENLLLWSHFEPARFFGQPVRGLAVLSFSGVSVRG